MPPANAYDKFSALLEVGEGLLARLYNIKHVYFPFSKERLPIYTDAGYNKVVAAFARKFPDAPSELEKVLCLKSMWSCVVEIEIVIDSTSSI